MSNHFFATLFRMKYIDRWALMRNTRQENICEHTQDVTVLSHALALLHNKRFGGNADVEKCLLLAMYHDVPEILTGDLPTPVKYDNAVIRDAYRQVEKAAEDKLLSQLPEDLREEYAKWVSPEKETGTIESRLVKAADKLSALIKCAEELKQGNREFEQAYRSTEKAIRELHLPAADCFLEEFIPSFELTLDEQQAD